MLSYLLELTVGVRLYMPTFFYHVVVFGTVTYVIIIRVALLSGIFSYPFWVSLCQPKLHPHCICWCYY